MSKYRPRLPKGEGRPRRSHLRAYQRALELAAAASAEHLIVMCISFAHVFEVPLESFQSALRRYKGRANRATQGSVERRAADAKDARNVTR